MTTLLAFCDALDPVLTGCGFGAGQHGGSATETSGQIIWCIGYEEFGRSFPGLPQSDEQQEDAALACVDLVLSVDHGRIVAVGLEGHTLPATFAAIDAATEARRAAEVLDPAASPGPVELAELVTRLVRTARV